MLQPAVYTGTLRHRRFTPRRHEFTYSLFMVMLDIDRIPALMRVSPLCGCNRWAWASFHDGDHFGDPALPLRARVEADAARNGVLLTGGPIYLLTHLRYLGYNFNPISLFYCLDPVGRVEAVLAEVNNTFGERHNYWLASSGGTGWRTAKRMHVSPFHPMELDYRFVLPAPGDGLLAHMETLAGEQRTFDATLQLRREPWSAPALHRALRRFPWMTAKVIAAIHWQALRLWWKRVPVYTHPARGKGREAHDQTVDAVR